MLCICYICIRVGVAGWFSRDNGIKNIQLVLRLENYLQVAVPIHEVGVVKFVLLQDGLERELG